MSKVPIAVIGCGALAQMMHLPYLRKHRDLFRIEAVCDISADLARRVAERFDIPRWTVDYRELLGSEIQGMLVLTNGSHGAISLALARAGKHTLVEKPLCYTAVEARAIQGALQEGGGTLLVGYMKRFDPGYRYARQVITDGPAPRYAQVTVLHPQEERYTRHHQLLRAADLPPELGTRHRSQSRTLAREALGEAPEELLDLYTDVLLGSVIHDLNATRHLLGEPIEVLSANAWAEQQAVSFDLLFDHDLLGHYSWCYFRDSSEYLEEIGVYSEGRRVTLSFPSPYLRHAPTPVTVETVGDDGVTSSRVVVSYQEAFERELLHFHACMMGAETPETPVEDGLQDILVLRAVARAVVTGSPQDIPAPGKED